MRKTGFSPRVVLLLAVFIGLNAALMPASAETEGGVLASATFTISMQPEGKYRIAVKDTGWNFDGALPAGFTVLPPSSGNDHLGHYSELSAHSAAGRLAAMRIYAGRPVVFFLDTWQKAGANDHPFPSFAALPADASRYSFKQERFSRYEFNALGEEGPWIFFHDKHAVVLSPADHYQISWMKLGNDGSAASTLLPQIAALPDGFTHATVMTAGDGVNAAMQSWGAVLQDYGGKHPMANENDDDPVMTRLGYWTDNGASYYYKFDPKLGYAGTLLAVKSEFDKLGIPLGYMQLDSWFYPKGKPSNSKNNSDDLGFGEEVYRADPKLFPDGLAAFHKQLGLPLVTHARWVSTTSPYRNQYKMSGNVVIDPKFWGETAAYLKDSGVITYEQDWLDHNATADPNLNDPSAFFRNMAVAMQQNGLTMQYCMAPPSDYMASAQYGNLTTIRTSDDRFERERWDPFLYASRMATVLGAKPWADVFMSPETGNLLIATLSGGPVGVGDALGQTSAENLRHVLNADGEIVKPDAGLKPIDRMYVEDAAGMQKPMIAVAASGSGRSSDARYVFAYPRKAADRQATVSLAELGIQGGAVAYDWVRRTVVPIAPGGTVTVQFDGESHDGGTDKSGSPDADQWGYVVVVPYEQDRIALIGDPERFTTLGKNSVVRMIRPGEPLAARVDFGDNKSTGPRTIVGYSAHRPKVASTAATAKLVSYDAKAGLFAIEVTREKADVAVVSLQ